MLRNDAAVVTPPVALVLPADWIAGYRIDSVSPLAAFRGRSTDRRYRLGCVGFAARVTVVQVELVSEHWGTDRPQVAGLGSACGEGSPRSWRPVRGPGL